MYQTEEEVEEFAWVMQDIMEVQRESPDKLDLLTTLPFIVTEAMKIHSQALHDFLVSEFENTTIWEHYQFWISRVSIELRTKLFENIWNNLDFHDGRCKRLFREMIISVEKYIDILKALFYSEANPNLLIPHSELSEISENNMLQICQPIIIFANSIYYELKDFKIAKHITLIYQFMHKFTEVALVQFKQSSISDVEAELSKKKKQVTRHSSSIRDEEFVPISLDNQNDLITLMTKFDSLSTPERIDELRKISVSTNTCINLFRNDIFYEFLRDLTSTNYADEVFEIFANVMAQSHVGDTIFGEEILYCIGKLIENSEQFFSKNCETLSISQCRLLSNCCFISDRFGCSVEYVLPALYNTLLANYDEDEHKSIPHITILKAVACFASIPNLRNSMHCIGFSSVCYRLTIDAKVPDMIMKMADTCSKWLNAVEIERIYFKSTFNEFDKIPFSKKKRMFGCSSEKCKGIPSTVPSRLGKIFPYYFGKFIITPADGYGIFKLIYSAKVDANKFTTTTFLFSVCSETLREVLFYTFKSMSELEYFMHDYIQILGSRTLPFNHCPTNTALKIINHLAYITRHKRTLERLEEMILSSFSKLFKENVGGEKPECSLVDLLMSLQEKSENKNQNADFSFHFFRQLLTTSFCVDFQFSQGEQDEFGFQNSYEKNIAYRPNQSDLVPITSLNVMNWIINMCSIIDNIPMAKQYLSNLFAFTAFYFQCNGNTDISNEIFNYVRNWMNGKARAVNLPFVAAFVERTLFFTGIDVLTNEYLDSQFKTNGLLKVTAVIVEDTRAQIPTIHAPRYKVYQLISQIIFSWMVSRKLKKKRIPTKELFLKRGMLKLMKIPDIKEITVFIILQLIEKKYLNFLSKVWKKIDQSYINQLDVNSLSGVNYDDSVLKNTIQKNKRETALFKDEQKPLPKIASNSLQSSCTYCKKSVLDLKRCGACKDVFYCSTECQKLDWKNHKHVCGKASK